MKLEAGKRYVTRDGRITKPLIYDADVKTFPYLSNIDGLWIAWTRNGQHLVNAETSHDLVHEYLEPREWFANKYPDDSIGPLYDTKDEAIAASLDENAVVVSVRELLE